MCAVFVSQSLQRETEAEGDHKEGHQARSLQELQAPDKERQGDAGQGSPRGRQTIKLFSSGVNKFAGMWTVAGVVS